jgi:hypothetical protein
MADVILAVGAGLINAFLTWYSVHVFLEKGMKKTAWVFGGLGACGVLCIGISAYRANAEQERARQNTDQVAAKLNTSLQSQQYMSGQLDSIKFLLAKFAENRPEDPALKQLATAISKMRFPSKAQQRQLSDEDKKKIKAAMHEFTAQPFMILCPPEKETSFFCADISSALQRSGWGPNPMVMVSYDVPWVGVEVCAGPPASQKLSELLGTIGVQMSKGHCDKTDPKSVMIEVGYGPP